MEEKKEPIRNDEIVHTCGACRKTLNKGEAVACIFPVVVTPTGQKVATFMICKYCGVLTALPDGSVEVPKIEQQKIISLS
jgi:hypothetical protein